MGDSRAPLCWRSEVVKISSEALNASRVCDSLYDNESALKYMKVAEQFYEGQELKLFKREISKNSCCCLWANTDRSKILISVEGTDEALDWLDNFNVAASYDELSDRWVHRGMMAHTDRVYQIVEKWATGGGETKPAEVTVCGHSLGGAVAEIIARRLSKLFSDDDVFIKCYTFGSPRVVVRNWSNVFSNYFTKMSRYMAGLFSAKYVGTAPKEVNIVPNNLQIYRFVNELDIVPMLPTSAIFEHSVDCIWLSSEGNIKEPTTREYMELVWKSTFIPGLQLIENHSIKDYIKVLELFNC